MIVAKEEFETWLEEVTCKELEYEDVFLDCDRERDWDGLEVVEDEREAAKEDEEEDEEDK